MVKVETGPKCADSQLKCSLSGSGPCRWELVGGTCMCRWWLQNWAWAGNQRRDPHRSSWSFAGLGRPPPWLWVRASHRRPPLGGGSAQRLSSSRHCLESRMHRNLAWVRKRLPVCSFGDPPVDPVFQLDSEYLACASHTDPTYNQNLPSLIFFPPLLPLSKAQDFKLFFSPSSWKNLGKFLPSLPPLPLCLHNKEINRIYLLHCNCIKCILAAKNVPFSGSSL